MKPFIYILFFTLFVLANNLQAQTKDTISQKRKTITITLTPVEIGFAIPIKDKKNDALPEPINVFANRKNTAINFNLLRLGILVKERYGIEAFYNFYTNQNYTHDVFANYISNTHPNYEKPVSVNRNYYNTSTWKGWEFALYYRIKIKKIYIEPKFQIGFEKFTQGNFEYYMKEKGSNQFIEYSLTSQNTKKYTPSYHYIVNVSRRLTPSSKKLKFELGLKFEYSVMNVNLIYNSSETPYGQPEKKAEYNVKQSVNAFTIAIFGRLFR